MSTTATNKLVPYFKAGYSVLYLYTSEETRVELEIGLSLQQAKRKAKAWSCVQGLFDPFFQRDPNNPKKADPMADATVKDPILALEKILQATNEQDHVYIFRDLHRYFKSDKVLRLIRDIARNFKQLQKTLIIISPVNELSRCPDLERDVTLIEYKLPDKRELGQMWDALYKRNKAGVGEIDDMERERIIQAACGLTTIEAEDACSKAIIDRNMIEPPSARPKISELVLVEKAAAIRKSGILEYTDKVAPMSDVGGLEIYKDWLEKRKLTFSLEAIKFGLKQPKGLLLIGPPGTGKSLSAKAAACSMGLPLIRFDLSRVFAGIVGATEANMRGALQTVDRIGACVLWIDELEKAFAGMSGDGAQDAGVSRRVFGQFLTWMQEKEPGALVLATVNSVKNLPPELLRKGRFDEIFYINLPTKRARAEIFGIQLRKTGRDPEKFNCEHLAALTEQHSGAEIEVIVDTALNSAFYAMKKNPAGRLKDLDMVHLEAAIKNSNPLARSHATELASMCEWADKNALQASLPDTNEAGTSELHGRALKL